MVGHTRDDGRARVGRIGWRQVFLDSYDNNDQSDSKRITVPGKRTTLQNPAVAPRSSRGIAYNHPRV